MRAALPFILLTALLALPVAAAQAPGSNATPDLPTGPEIQPVDAARAAPPPPRDVVEESVGAGWPLTLAFTLGTLVLAVAALALAAFASYKVGGGRR